MATLFGVSLNPFSTPVGEKIGKFKIIYNSYTILLFFKLYDLKNVY